MAFKKGIERRETELISLVDIIFLLLVFFLVSTGLVYKMTSVQELLNISIPKLTEQQLQTLSITGKKKKESAHLIIQAFWDKSDRKTKFYLLHECLTPTTISQSISKDYARIDTDIWPQVPWLEIRPDDRPDGRYYFGSARELNQPVGYEVVEKRIKSIKKLLKDPKIIIRAESDVSFELVANLLGLCNQQEIIHVSLTAGSLGTLDDFVRGI